MRTLHLALWKKKVDCLKVCVPAIAYAIQNNLYYIALANIDATAYTIDVSPSAKNNHSASKVVGVLATVGMCWTSAFAAEFNYNDKQKTFPLTAFIRATSTYPIMLGDEQNFERRTRCELADGLLQGWTGLVWITTTAAAIGGVVVSAVMKYADNVKKTYCQSLAIGGSLSNEKNAAIFIAIAVIIAIIMSIP
ncbi:hypothetical protein KIN20_036047 [Parelaphostrongylus tenuis]|uniref:Uncharacterized protein n=1 Tax=Parelaphostrongylus tenuis TaxID=148309 RepID=A0AAD5RCN7_PARTN|nr:hypothetical protein KIN20_036047 [Parelaphostrongylus tenuis]